MTETPLFSPSAPVSVLSVPASNFPAAAAAAEIPPDDPAGHVALSEDALIEKEFGVPLENLYRMAVKYYRDHEKEGSLVVSYEERTKFMALSKQVRYGPFDESQSDTGWFDFVGSDRTKAWQELGSLSRSGAMTSFVFLLDRVCPPFKQFVHDQLAVGPKLGERRGLQAPEDTDNEDGVQQQQQQQQLIQMRREPIDWQLVEAQRKQIQEALNAQTYHQFRAYAQQQLPGQPEQQEALIRQLQEQHYQQYMAQVYAQQQAAELAAAVGGGGEGGEEGGDQQQKKKQMMMTAEMPQPPIVKPAKVVDEEEAKKRDDDSDVSDEEPGEDIPSNPAIAPASLWNRNDIQQFKDTIKKEGSEGIIKVGHGETVTIRVPTHEDGSCLFWEFATDYYDIGFGVLFEWSISETNQVSIHVSESDEEDEEGLEGGEAAAEGEGGIRPGTAPGDVEGGNPAKEKRRDPNKPHQDEIIPVYRRDCHEEVYAGSHQYPGRGVYLLKFDNSYSLWRSKTLYYRVYYSK